VLVEAVMRLLEVRPGALVLDATVGSAGHAARLLQAALPGGKLLALDQDPAAVDRASRALAEFGDRAVVVRGRFDDLAELASRAGFDAFDAALFDLGYSSDQMEDPRRGFSFRVEGPLDMRLDPATRPTAAELVNSLAESELADLIYGFGEEPRSRRIARAIVRERPLHTTTELADIVARSSGYRRGRTHPATRTFQALRIAVNDELDVLARGIEAGIRSMKPGGRLGVISFHSLEDRIVKDALRTASRDCICPPELPECRCTHLATVRVVTRKPVVSEPDEVAANPRARSAKLRVAERLPDKEQRS
jgi:16S rRNA (cytosine1402-N4)-methyltransferase